MEPAFGRLHLGDVDVKEADGRGRELLLRGQVAFDLGKPADPAGMPGIRAAAEAHVMRHLALIEDAAGRGAFLPGAARMGVDFLIWVLLTPLDRDRVAAVAPRVQARADALTADPRLAATAARHL